MSTIGEWLDIAKSVVFHPAGFYRDIVGEEGLGGPLVFAIISLLIAGILRVAVSLILGGAVPMIAETGSLTDIGIRLAGIVVAAPIAVLISAAVMHLFVFLLGGRGYGRTVQVMAFSTAVTAMFGWIPIIGAVSALYLIYVQIVGVRELHGFSTARAAAAVLLPVIIAAVLAAASIMFFMAAMIAGTGPLQGASGGGGFDSCPKTAPSFAGQPLSIDTWSFTSTNEIMLALQATQGTVELDHLWLDYDQDGVVDDAFPAGSEYDEELRIGSSTTVTLNTGSRFSPGDCAAMDVTIQVTNPSLGSPTNVTGDGALRGPAP